MPERLVPVDTFFLVMDCDRCGEGQMRVAPDVTGAEIVAEDLTRHRCDACGHEDKYAVVYPKVERRPRQ